MTVPFPGDKPHMKTIDFAEGLRLPIEVASSPIAFLAQRGRGKTRGAKKLAEAFHGAGIPPIVLDAAGVWWGLRLGANGKSRGLDIPVLGGLHGDQPLAATGGKVLAEALVRTRRGCVIDVTGFASEADKIRFASDFAETFYRQKMQHRSPVHLFLEEADEWIPQEPGPNEARMLGAFQRIVRLGRNFGIGVTMISLRPQGLSKKVLNLAEVVITLGMAAKHERKAMTDWMADHEVTPERAKEVLDQLPRLGWNKFTKQDGGALVWAPLLDLFGVFPVKTPATFDSSATPEVGDDHDVAALPALNLDDLARAMAATVEEAKANDPKELKAEIARLKVELSRKPSVATATKAERVEVQVPAAELMDVLRKASAAAHDAAISAQDADAKLWQVVDQIRGDVARALRAPVPVGRAPAPAAPLRPLPTAQPKRKAAGPGEDLPKGERAVLISIAQHPDGVSREQLTVLTGYKRSSRDTYIQRLRERGHVETPGDQVNATDAGIAALGGDYEPLPTGDELRKHWLAKLPEGERRVLEVLVESWPNAVAREELDEPTGYKRSSRDTYLQRLGARKLVDTIGRGEVKASDLLFGEGG